MPKRHLHLKTAPRFKNQASRQGVDRYDLLQTLYALIVIPLGLILAFMTFNKDKISINEDRLEVNHVSRR